MDPLTAIANMIASICDLAKTVIASQPPDVQRKLWEDHLKRLDAINKFFKIDGSA